MELTNDFRVAVPVDEAWKILTDVERIAPCMPGAQLQEIQGDEYRGVVKVKVGPITAQYKGTATFVDKDDSAHRAVLRAEGRDTRGQGNASATVTATLEPDGSGTKVSVVTDLTITGKVAQFGRGVLAEVSGKLIGQFVDNLERDVLSTVGAPSGGASAVSETVRPESAARVTLRPGDAPAAADPEPAIVTTNGAGATAPPATSPEEPQVRRVQSREAEPVDLLATAGSPVVKRALPVVAALLVVVLLLRRRRRRRRRS